VCCLTKLAWPGQVGDTTNSIEAMADLPRVRACARRPQVDVLGFSIAAT